jgi:hypothetical protein
MRKALAVPVLICTMFVLSCSPAIQTGARSVFRTEKPIRVCIVVSDASVVSDDQEHFSADRLSGALSSAFASAGYSVTFACLLASEADVDVDVVVAVSSYRYEEPTKDACILTGLGLTFISVAFAPVLFFRGYYQPQVDLCGSVTVRDRVTSAVIREDVSERAVASSGLFSSGEPKAKDALIERVMHNFSAAVITAVARLRRTDEGA